MTSSALRKSLRILPVVIYTVELRLTSTAGRRLVSQLCSPATNSNNTSRLAAPQTVLQQTQLTMSDVPKQFDSERLKQRLTEMEFAVTQEKATEPPFTGEYLHNKKPGVYTCVVCGSTLFASHHKFESGCGWPAFSEVLSSAAVTLTQDNSLGMQRTEVTCTQCSAHLGHVFDDGPPPKRTRYCINSAAMSFTPAD